MSQHFIISEHGTIRRKSDYPASALSSTLAMIYVSGRAFDELKQLAFKAQSDTILGFMYQKGYECLRVKNHVGLLQTSDGTQIEILPKIFKNDNPIQARLSLLRMLRCISHLPFQTLTQAHLHQVHLPLWEIFVAAFITEIEKITQQGIQKSYLRQESGQPFLRGKLLPNRQNSFHLEVFYVATDEFQINILPNQLLKTCLVFLVGKSQYCSNQKRLEQLRLVWEEVDESNDIRRDFERVNHLGKDFNRYVKALQWAEILLNRYSWNTSGNNRNESLMFPMERLFENYVTLGVKKYLIDYEVFCQDNIHFLINDHAGKQRFSIRPDLVLKKDNRVLVLDIKWKRIEPNITNYGIEQADLYQLYAYGQKYQANVLFLVYPAHESFQTTLSPFHFDHLLMLIVVPFDTTNFLVDEIQKLRETIETNHFD